MPEVNIRNIIESVLLALRNDIKPALTQDQARHRAELIDMLLSRLAIMMGSGDADQLLDIEKSLPDDTIRRFIQAPELHDDSLKREIVEQVRATAKSERHRREQTELEISLLLNLAPPTDTPGTRSAFSKHDLSDYLKESLPDSPEISVTAIEPIPGGRSKGTILLTTTGKGGLKSLIVRHDLQNMVTGSSVAYEYPVLLKLWQQGAKVPRPLLFEEKNDLFGGPFILLERIEGKAMGTMFSTNATPELIKEFAKLLAQLHNIDITGSGLSECLKWGNAHNPVKVMLDANFDKYQEAGFSHPLLDRAFAWLFLNADELNYHPTLVHGDAGLHNALATDRTITSILDWELAHAGDPAEDLSYCRDVIEAKMPWTEFLATYTQHSKQPVDEDRIVFFTVWRSVQLAIQTLTARNLFVSGSDRDLRLAAIAYNTLPKFLNRLAVDLDTYS